MTSRSFLNVSMMPGAMGLWTCVAPAEIANSDFVFFTFSRDRGTWLVLWLVIVAFVELHLAISSPRSECRRPHVDGALPTLFGNIDVSRMTARHSRR